ncbi:MAG: hypothetical protein KGL35_25590 [Bradyrhizobium sp.]|nr:hypothetical protein [Bradyrhizobium sp.]
MKTITSANAVYGLSIVGLFPTPQQLQGFATDDIFDTASLAPAETMMGVDGKLSAGFVYVPVVQTISLQADSDSNGLFEAWYAAQIAASETYRCNAVVRLVSVGRSYQLTNGVLTGYVAIADAKKVLQPRKYQITWERVVGVPV